MLICFEMQFQKIPVVFGVRAALRPLLLLLLRLPCSPVVSVSVIVI